MEQLEAIKEINNQIQVYKEQSLFEWTVRPFLTNGLYTLPNGQRITSTYYDMNQLLKDNGLNDSKENKEDPHAYINIHEVMTLRDLSAFAEINLDVAKELLEEYKDKPGSTFVDIQEYAITFKQYKTGNQYTIDNVTYTTTITKRENVKKDEELPYVLPKSNDHEVPDDTIPDEKEQQQQQEEEKEEEEEEEYLYRHDFPHDMVKKLVDVLPPQVYEQIIQDGRPRYTYIPNKEK